ncbi:MAG TPA: Zn-ribbon domain-containing OB-fold protein [Anaerolineae bacterium]|nr:Zn-ribbon domain-containing OB-fold protein [Anaerolineae bacterium]
MSLPRHWRLQNQRYQMVGEVCLKCGAKLFPPRDVCPECSKPAYEPFTFSGKGTVYSFSTVYQAPAGYEEFVPYTVALVKLDEGPMVSAQLTDVDREEVAIGMPVEMVTRKMREEGEDGLIVYGYKFRAVHDHPVNSAEAA